MNSGCGSMLSTAILLVVTEISIACNPSAVPPPQAAVGTTAGGQTYLVPQPGSLQQQPVPVAQGIPQGGQISPFNTGSSYSRTKRAVVDNLYKGMICCIGNTLLCEEIKHMPVNINMTKLIAIYYDVYHLSL